MRPSRLAAVAVLALFGLSAAGCSKSDTTGPNTITLSQAEVSQLFTEIGGVMDSVSLGFNVSHGTAAGPRLSVVPRLLPGFSAMGPISATVNCPVGGNAAVSGSVGGTTTVTFDVTFAFTGCKTANYTIGGSLRESGSITATQTTLAVQVRVQGTLAVSASNGRSGNCGVDFTVTVTNASVTAAGTACGVNANGTVN